MMYCKFGEGELPNDDPKFAVMQGMLKKCVSQSAADSFRDQGREKSTGVAAWRKSADRILASEYCTFREATDDFTEDHRPVYRPAYRFEMFMTTGVVKPGRPAPWAN